MYVGDAGHPEGLVAEEAGGWWKWVLDALGCHGTAPPRVPKEKCLDPPGRVELGGERLAQTCRSLAGNDRRWPAGPSPLIFPAGLVWESALDPK